MMAQKCLIFRRMNLSHTGLMRDQLAINTDRTEYGDGRAEIYDLGLLDAREM